MVHTYVYILVLLVGWNSGAVTSTVVEFTSAEACSDAILQLERPIDDRGEAAWYSSACLYKGT